jgi:hypothetical protein
MRSPCDGTATKCRGPMRLAIAFGAAVVLCAASPTGATTCALDGRAAEWVDRAAQATAMRDRASDCPALAGDEFPPVALAPLLPGARAVPEIGGAMDSPPSPAPSIRVAAAGALWAFVTAAGSGPTTGAASVGGGFDDHRPGDGAPGNGDHDHPTPTPLPASQWLLVAALGGLVVLRRPASTGARRR